jgi:hypothetical protein
VGKSLNFSKFAQLLYPYCARGIPEHMYVVLLVDEIMTQPRRCSIKDGKKIFLNPMLNVEKRSRNFYYSASDPSRCFPKSSADIIRRHLNKKGFVKFISSLPEAFLVKLANEIDGFCDTPVDKDNVAEICTDIFETILWEGDYKSI